MNVGYNADRRRQDERAHSYPLASVELKGRADTDGGRGSWRELRGEKPSPSTHPVQPRLGAPFVYYLSWRFIYRVVDKILV